MKIFISWSGGRSRAVAELLRDWIKCVIQATRPWISTRDIDRGALWFAEINDQLKDTTVGIVCLTQENKNRPWILFESGALAKGLSSNRVCTFLIDLEPKDLVDPLAQFNHTLPTRDSVRSLIFTLNGCLGVNALDERILDLVFDTYWFQFEEQFGETILHNQPTEKIEPRSEENLLGEILENTRFLKQRVRDLEIKTSKDNHIGPRELAFKMTSLSEAEAVAIVHWMEDRGYTVDAIVDQLVFRGVPLRIAKTVVKVAAADNSASKTEPSKLAS